MGPTFLLDLALQYLNIFQLHKIVLVYIIQIQVNPSSVFSARRKGHMSDRDNIPLVIFHTRVKPQSKSYRSAGMFKLPYL